MSWYAGITPYVVTTGPCPIMQASSLMPYTPTNGACPAMQTAHHIYLATNWACPSSKASYGYVLVCRPHIICIYTTDWACSSLQASCRVLQPMGRVPGLMHYTTTNGACPRPHAVYYNQWGVSQALCIIPQPGLMPCTTTNGACPRPRTVYYNQWGVSQASCRVLQPMGHVPVCRPQAMYWHRPTCNHRCHSQVKRWSVHIYIVG